MNETAPRKPRVLLCVTGCVQAEVTPRLVHNLLNHPELSRVELIVAATEASLNFFEKADVEKLTGGRPVFVKHTDATAEFEVPHLSLPEWADLILVYPASANTIAKCVAGICDTLVTNIILAGKRPVWFGPTMNDAMYLNPVTQKNIQRLEKMGHHLMPKQLAPIYIHATKETVEKEYVTEACVLSVIQDAFPR